MTELSSEDSRSVAIAAMGSPLGEIYDILYSQVAWVHIKWSEHCSLYAKNQERIDFLNEAAPAFFASLQTTLWDDILLHLCRLTDPEMSAGKKNLTPPMSSAADPRHWPGESGIGPTETSKRQDYVRETMEKSSGGTPGLSRRDHKGPRIAYPWKSARCSRSASSNKKGNELHYMRSTVLYEHSIEALGSADALLECLQKGVNEKRRRRGLPPISY